MNMKERVLGHHLQLRSTGARRLRGSRFALFHVADGQEPRRETRDKAGHRGFGGDGQSQGRGMREGEEVNERG